MVSIQYFAYGSNMLRQRLLARCPNSTFAGRATLAGYHLSFDKRSTDGSGKCTITSDASCNVKGALWNITEAEMPALDRLEGVGRGYQRCSVAVTRNDGTIKKEVQTYHAPRSRVGIGPYDWYLALVIAGAKQHSLPDDYIARLRNTAFQVDKDAERPSRREALRVLAQANMLGVLDALQNK